MNRKQNNTLIRNFFLFVLATAPLQTQAADALSPPAARAAAIQVLMGDPYGKTQSEVALNIASSQLITAGDTSCGGGRAPPAVWQFHVVVPANRNPNGNKIDGFLLLDARTGKLKCAGLPFLD